MPKDQSVLQIELMFKGLNQQTAAFPGQSALSNSLNGLIGLNKTDFTNAVNRTVVLHFATAAIEMWQRSVHSFLISASLTKSSPIWSSVAGYYSSHYAIRGFAHLLGHFQLHAKKWIVTLEINGGTYSCHFRKKDGSDREHSVYWKLVKANPIFGLDPFFTNNEDVLPGMGSEVLSDGGHRNKANYSDHVGRFPQFQILDVEELKQRVTKISKIEFSDAPIPRINFFPDLDNVQVIAYHRMVRFRHFLDKVLGGSNRFWTIQRKPTWCPQFLEFQVIQPEYATLYNSIT
jgi:hypothetical protein